MSGLSAVGDELRTALAASPSPVTHLGLATGLLGAVAGLIVGGVESATLWALVGYFAGKSVQSAVWMLRGR
jgi:hypothetical protein